MCVNIIIFFAASLCFSYGDETILLESFSSPVHQWKAKNDPVMGGKSYGTFTIQEGVGIFDGEVVDVPFLRAPGFITMQTIDQEPFSDVSSCSHLQLNLRTNTPYKGFRVSFGTAQGSPDMRYGRGYKAPFDLPVGDDFMSVNIPFTDFSDYWNEATGDLVKTCQENEKYCPDSKTLQNMEQISIWGEGVDGVVHLEVKSIAALGCSNENQSQYLIPKSRESVNLVSPSESSINLNDGTIPLESFSSPVHQWKAKNDPVMGGKSYGTFTIQEGVGIFDGKVVDVPFLRAPGFITMQTIDKEPFSDVSSCSHLQLNLRTNTSYKGFRVSFGTARGSPDMRFGGYGYKSPFDLPVGDNFMSVNIPFTNFSDYWNEATGDLVKTCQENVTYCPDSKTLQNMEQIQIWGEGVDGVVHLEVKSIAALGCSNENESQV